MLDVKVDLVLTDPPYGIDYDPARASSNGKWHKWHEDKVEGDSRPFEPAFLMQYRKLILWGANAYSDKLPVNYGWLVWDKQIPAGMLVSHCEMAWTNYLSRVFKFEHLWNGLCRDTEVGKHLHPTQKPVRLMEWCLSLAPDCQTVLDPFLGSGTTAVACKQLGRKCIGVEISEKYCEIAVKRLAQEVMSFPHSP